MRRLLFIALFISAVPLSGFAADRPNVLFLAVDDLRPNLGCYGVNSVHSPFIDRLAKTGIVFRRAYCQIASCGPSRASLLTGLRPDTTTVFDNRRSFRAAVPNAVTLPQYFKEHGYHTRSLGKVFHGIFESEINEDPPSWSEPAWRPPAIQYRSPEGILTLHQRYPKEFPDPDALAEAKQGIRRFKGLAVEAPDCEDEDLIDGRTAAKTVQVLREIGDRSPFFLAVGFVKPHAPFVAPKNYFDLYSDDDVSAISRPEPDSYPIGAPEQAHNHHSRELRGYAGIAADGPLPIEQVQWVTHGYNACVSYVDVQVGKILEELDRLRLRENTIVILWGDHGYHLGHNGMWCKNTNFEAATRVPLVVSAPGAKGNGRSTNGIVELIDLYPTLAELCSLPPVPGLPGQSFRHLLDSPSLAGKAAALSQTPRPYTQPEAAMGHSIRTDRFRFVEWTGTTLEKPVFELYDFEANNPESKNLADKPEYSGTIKALRDQLNEMLSARGNPDE